ncbi:MAG TPA: hypothetical protein VG055_03170 [Planctomycetaceae bacterium]|jgi:hypothetical protein|nr:hypothetical protein [Planctomycetaceae bacterium]
MAPRDRSAATGLNCGRIRLGRRFAAIVGAAALLLVASQVTLSASTRGEAPGPADRTLDVRVTFEGKPVAGAQVVAIEVESQIRAVTDRDGKCQLRLAADGKLASIIALDARLGVGGRSFRFRTVPTQPRTTLEIPLAPAEPHTIRVIDHQGNAVRLASIAVSGIPTKHGWQQTGVLEAAQLHTDSRGEAHVAWIPRGAEAVGVESTDDRWKLDDAHTNRGITTVRATRLHPVDGRLSMPDGMSPEGLSIMGEGRGSTAMGHRPSARVRKNGTFTLYVAAGDAYSLAVVDNKWASDLWSGVILQSDNAPPKELNLVVYPAVPLGVLVTRGPKHEPVNGASVIVFSFDRQRGSNGPLRTLSTNQHGRAEFAVARGQYQVYMATDNWKEHQAITVPSDEPVSVEFYRGWGDKRTFWGWLIAEHRPHRPGPATVVRAWNPAKRQMAAEAAVTPEGAFSFSSDTSEFYLFAVDRKNLLSGARAIVATDANANVELTPMGSVRGVIVDAAGKGLAGQGIEAVFAGPDLHAWPIVLQSATSDDQGRFQLDALPSGISLRICAGTPARARGTAFTNRSDNFRVHTSRELTLEPGEVRENVGLVRRGTDSKD